MLSYRYLAGMVDADGCIQAHQSGIHTSGLKYRYPRLQVTNTNWSLIEDLINSFGGHSIKKHSKGKGTFPNRRDCYDWRLDGDSARELIQSIMPYLRIKYKKAVDVLLLDSSIYGPGA